MMEKQVLLRITAQAARQHGVFTRQNALTAGASESLIDRRIRRGEWQRPYPGVYVINGTPATWMRAVTVAVLGSGEGAIASHRTAAHLWELCSRPRVIEVTTPHRGRPRRPHVIHRSTDLEPHDITKIEGIPATTVARTLVDVGVPWGEGLASRVLDEAVRRGLTDLLAVAATLHRVGRKGRRGAGVMRMVLQDRLGWAIITESQLESEFLRIMVAAGVQLPQAQVRIVKRGGRTIGRVDFVYPELRLVIELDGERYHADRNTFRSDRRRQNDLVLEGYRVLRFTTWDVFAAPNYVVAQVVAALSS
jgi:very-short-patch-repair endonuclease